MFVFRTVFKRKQEISRRILRELREEKLREIFIVYHQFVLQLEALTK